MIWLVVGIILIVLGALVVLFGVTEEPLFILVGLVMITLGIFMIYNYNHPKPEPVPVQIASNVYYLPVGKHSGDQEWLKGQSKLFEKEHPDLEIVTITTETNGVYGSTSGYFFNLKSKSQ
jgi:uncharacterized membrane protein YfcA